VRFTLRLDGRYLESINPNFDTLYKLVMALAETADLEKYLLSLLRSDQ